MSLSPADLDLIKGHVTAIIRAETEAAFHANLVLQMNLIRLRVRDYHMHPDDHLSMISQLEAASVSAEGTSPRTAYYLYLTALELSNGHVTIDKPKG